MYLYYLFRCGAQFTTKLEGMLNDLILGADHTKEFDDYCLKNAEAKGSIGKVEYSVQVLTTGYWPTYRTHEVNLPPAMLKCSQVFKVSQIILKIKRKIAIII